MKHNNHINFIKRDPMFIKKIYVSNFKSFKNLEIELDKFNVLIGANASGKSNFIQILKFLNNITKNGLKSAISMQGGIKYLRNLNLDNSEKLSIKIISEKFGFVAVRSKKDDLKNKAVALRVSEEVYEFTILFRKKEFQIIKDELTFKGDFVELTADEDELNEEKIMSGKVKLTKIDKEISIESEEIPIEDYDVSMFREKEIKENTLILENSSLLSFIFPPVGSLFENISFYDFDPKLSKRAVPITGKIELEEDGRNLPISLKNILDDKENEEIFLNLMKDVLPLVNKVGTENFEDMSIILKLQESGSKDFFPAPFISDGTINITALITALYFEESPLAVIEEPERNMHPHLISKIISMMQEASEDKQIILTTHNPEIIKHVNLKNILLISRDKNNFSKISRPYEKEHVKTFLEDDIGIDDLYIRNLLG